MPSRLRTTEQSNPESVEIDRLSAIEIVRLMNRQDGQVIEAIAAVAEPLAAAIEWVAEAFCKGGRLIYIGAGTSGRLGVLDASECPPTFNSDPGQVIGLIAGGKDALTRSIEGAEDSPQQGARDLELINLSAADVLVGIATSGRTPYVLGAVAYARSCGCQTIGLSCNSGSELETACDLAITTVVGPEVVSGSTRLKAGTATKLVLNTLTTGAMVRIGKTYGNLMVDLRASNSKLVDRSRRIVAELTGISADQAQDLLAQCDGELKTAVVSHLAQCDAETARQRLKAAKGHLRTALQDHGTSSHE